jgi:hypothetical protein
VERFIENIGNRNIRQGNTVYDDRQNVHNITVQNSIRDSLNKLTSYTQLTIKSKLSNEEISFLDNQEVHSFFHFTQKEVLLSLRMQLQLVLKITLTATKLKNSYTRY